jgi:hypothetical protein
VLFFKKKRGKVFLFFFFVGNLGVFVNLGLLDLGVFINVVCLVSFFM